MSNNAEKYLQEMGEITKESTVVLSNSLKSIFSRIELDSVREYLSTKNIEVAGDGFSVLGNIASKWRSLSESEQMDIGMKVSGRYNLSRFMILMYQLSADK